MRFHSLVLACAVLFSSAVASADLIATPPDYGDCTLEKQQKAGEDCQVCDGLYEATCEKKQKPQGYAQRCKIQSPGGWHEVWCKAPGAASTAPSAPPAETKPATETKAAPAETKAAPAEKASAGCAVSGTGGEGQALLLAGLALTMILLRRRASF
jgi:MYXO-CTERM domain-containing protein